jgi:hypothetical protein
LPKACGASSPRSKEREDNLAVLASLALVPAAIGVLAPSGPDDGCPSPRQVADALGAHLPGVVLPLGQAPGPTALRLGVAADPSGAIRVDLTDASGETELHRALSPTERVRGADCPALAETVALIVERYWREVGYDLPPLERPKSPPPAPAPPPATSLEAAPPREPAQRPPAAGSWLWAVGAAGAERAGGGTVASLGLAAGVEHRIGLRLSGGITESDAVPLAYATGHFRRYPLRLGAYLPVRLGPGQLEPGLGLDLEEISVGLSDVTAGAYLAPTSLCRGVFCASPGVDLALGWSAWSTHHVFVRALTRAQASVSYRFVADGKVIWSTPATYAEFALECGAWFR